MNDGKKSKRFVSRYPFFIPLSLSFVSLMVACVIAEAVLRICGIGYGNCPFVPDRVFHHKYPKNYSLISYTPSGAYGGFPVSFNSDGYVFNPRHKIARNDKTHKKLAVFMGDSFVAAMEVPYDKSFVGVLESRFSDLDVKNFGVGTSSPVLYYVQWKYEIKRLRPDKVFMLLYSNDCREDREYIVKAKYSPDGELIAVDGGVPNKAICLLRRSYLVRLLRKAYLQFQYMRSYPRVEEKRIVAHTVEESPKITALTQGFVLRVARQVKAGNGEFVLMVVPSTYNLYNGIEDPEEFSRQWQRWAAENGVQFLDLVTPFRRAYRKNGRKPFFDQDIHFNEYGHSLVANEIAALLSR